MKGGERTEGGGRERRGRGEDRGIEKGERRGEKSGKSG